MIDKNEYEKGTRCKGICCFCNDIDGCYQYSTNQIKEMTLNEAISICQARINLDRSMRDNQVVNDYDKFCENECLAIEILIECCKSKMKGSD